jgi:hypothetical protein
MAEDRIQRLSKLELRAVGEQNEVRETQGVAKIKITVRGCLKCDTKFETFMYRTCNSCRNYNNQAAARADIRYWAD